MAAEMPLSLCTERKSSLKAPIARLCCVIFRSKIAINPSQLHENGLKDKNIALFAQNICMFAKNVVTLCDF